MPKARIYIYIDLTIYIDIDIYIIIYIDIKVVYGLNQVVLSRGESAFISAFPADRRKIKKAPVPIQGRKRSAVPP